MIRPKLLAIDAALQLLRIAENGTKKKATGTLKNVLSKIKMVLYVLMVVRILAAVYFKVKDNNEE